MPQSPQARVPDLAVDGAVLPDLGEADLRQTCDRGGELRRLQDARGPDEAPQELGVAVADRRLEGHHRRVLDPLEPLRLADLSEPDGESPRERRLDGARVPGFGQGAAQLDRAIEPFGAGSRRGRRSGMRQQLLPLPPRTGL